MAAGVDDICPVQVSGSSVVGQFEIDLMFE
jgi:hypothetical protein